MFFNIIEYDMSSKEANFEHLKINDYYKIIDCVY